ncbi:protoporphyrinogen oxidase [Paenibacillus chondroitinus]|uniref:Coproporphyrinogen III oxidase n=1 Tax=Paenibacillus chondroitinus TaxID=59842 RepID=A0ABU6DBL8_9BACL|nr:MULTISPECIES: protoporphyrinogen oxidase [Paenibacillus]MCY9658981.1 protoporphyrinogen oxidase [Paenibacillus anseongense]MEB4794851.1 protoporphyrinogen oxidase [Paenibacillus chondroitinus]
MSTPTPHYMIVGGGITGLSAAFYLKKRLEAEGRPFRISVVEKAAAFGGKIRTIEKEGFVIEKGPDSFLARKRPIIDLAYDLGLEQELTGTNPKAKKTYIVRQGKLHRMPPGLVLGIPTQMTPFMKTGLISPLGKVRAALDLVLPKREITNDESLGHFLERRLGKEVLERIVEPLLAGIYAGDTFNLSLKSTFPQFRTMEQKHRSLILGMMASRKNVPEETAHLPAAIRSSVFVTFKKGLQTLVSGLVAALESADLRTGLGVASIRQAGQQTEILFEDGSSEIVDGVIVTSPTYQAAQMLGHFPAASELKKIDYISVANVIMAFDRKDIPFELDASGFLVPRNEGSTITACTLTSAKWLHTAPEGKVLLRCYIGRSGEQEWPAWSDEQLISKARHDLRNLLGLTAEPLFTEVTRLNHSMPQYPVGHLEQIARFREELNAAMPQVLVTGAGFHGVGLPDCIRQGKEAAWQLADRIIHQSAKEPAVTSASV